MSDFDNKRYIWYRVMIEKGHTPQVDEEGKLEFMAFSIGEHNGPGCTACKWSCCWHCSSIEDIPKCTGKKEY